MTMTKTEEKFTPSVTQLLERRVRELSTLHEIARAVTSVLDLESVLNRIVEASVYLTNAEEGFLLLVDEATGDLTLRAGKGLGEKASRVMSLKVTDSIAGQVIKTGLPVRMGGFQRDEQYKVKTGYLAKSLVNVPIKSAGRVIGVLAVDHSILSMRSFSDHDVALLSSLADYAAIAIQNAHLFAEASSRAEELAKALEEQTGVKPVFPATDQYQQALEQLVEGLSAQREAMQRSVEGTHQLARDLQTQAQHAEEVSKQLGLWDEEMLNLLPQLEWLTQAGLPLAEQPAAAPATPSPAAPASPTTPGPTADYQLLKHLAEGALVCDAKGVIHDANEAAAKILGKPVSELIGEDLQSILDDPRWERMVGSLRLALAMAGGMRAKPPAPETTLYVNDHIIRAKLVPVHEGQPEAATLIAALFQDVSAENEGWRARDETLADLSHKLRGPMTAIASYSDLLLGDTVGVVDAMQRRYLQRIRQGIQRLEAALNELLEEPDTSGQRTTPAPTYPISAVIHQAVDAAQKVLSLEGVNIIKNIAQDLPSVPMDPNYVNRILADLLTAAGTCTNCGDNVHVGTQVQLEDAQPKHLVILIQSGAAPRRDSSIIDSDENVREAMSLAEGAGGRVWIDDEADGSIVISFLLPIAEPVLSGRP